MNPVHRKENGQALIGLIIASGIMSILTLTIASLVISSYELLTYTSSRTTAKHIATEHLEIIRNLSYEDIGTSGGIPSGTLPQTDLEERNGLPYIINTRIEYVDDPFDGQAPDDTVANDYKRVRIEVSWGGISASRGAPVTLVSDISPRGVETTTGGGTLSILVFNSLGEPVSDADVRILATSQGVDLTTQTDNNGRVLQPGAPACKNSCYQITVSKDGYSSERTYSTTEVSTPNKPHQNVLEDELTEISFAIDKVSTLTVTSTSDRTANFAPLPGQTFTLKSDKTIGTNAQDDPVYKFTQNFTTGANGEVEIKNLEWGTYQFTPSGSSYDISGTNPLLPIQIVANTSTTYKYANAAHSNNTLLLTFLDTSSSPVASVSAELRDAGNPVATVSSGILNDPDYGQSFFANLLAKTYQLVATASGYATYSANISVNGQTQNKIILSP